MSQLRRSSRAILALASLVFAGGCSLDADDDIPPVIPLELQQWGSSLNIDLATMTRLESGVYFKDAVVGTGTTLTGTPTVRFFYTGYLASGAVFDSNVGATQPYEQPLAALIPAFSTGLQGMKVGGKRRLVIPSALGYGETGALGAVPPNANLVFDIELVGIV
jgi:FKBP-type peptidyl-prolyl cis-trans isomerase